MAKLRPLPNVAALTRAVQHSAEWRGMVVGSDDDTEEAFDREMARRRKALRDLRRHLAYHQALRNFMHELTGLSAGARDAYRNEQVLHHIIRRAKALYP